MSFQPRKVARRLLKGFTLAEALLACVILAMVSAAVVVPFAAGARHEQVGARQTIALSLAEDLMEEILAKPFKDPDDPDSQNLGPDAGETAGDRSTFDNMDDYYGYIEQPGAIQPAMTTHATDPLARDLSRLAKVGYLHLPGQNPSDPPNTCQIAVYVLWNGRELVRLTRLVHDYGNED